MNNLDVQLWTQRSQRSWRIIDFAILKSRYETDRTLVYYIRCAESSRSENVVL